ncbi:MAG: 4'-phosphopantetheinyl transferase superfamily protein [Candidatus Melainabacteria bacterium]|nr:MAG: 4'-phosphopantetheinyl transferase superfamily protein [Candidatus Melainabacteria bacterium]
MNTNLSQGIDIEEIIRFEKYENDINSKFLSRIFTKNELDYCFSKKILHNIYQQDFAQKEACIKALFPFENKNFF